MSHVGSVVMPTLKWFFMEGLLANDDVESTSNLRRIRIYVEFTSNLRRIYVEFTSNRGLEKPWGVFFGAIKSPCGNGHTHSLGFKNTVFSYVKTLGHICRGIKSPCGNGHTHSLVLGKYRSRTPASNPVPPGCVVRVPAHWAI